MYTLHLDFQLRYTPPMPERGPCIALTRAIEIPFPPHEGLSLFSAEMDQCPKPDGFVLKDVVWDIDRKLFLPTTSMTDGATPVGGIVEQIQDWLDRGWVLGSCRDTYADFSTEPPVHRKRRRGRIADEDLEHMQVNPLPRRPDVFMQEFRAWVRFLAENFAEDWAYAMDRGGVVLTSGEFDGRVRPNPEWKAWHSRVWEYGTLDEKQRAAWMRKVKRYPRWTSLLG
jgi:hypothetical protein